MRALNQTQNQAFSPIWSFVSQPVVEALFPRVPLSVEFTNFLWSKCLSLVFNRVRSGSLLAISRVCVAPTPPLAPNPTPTTAAPKLLGLFHQLPQPTWWTTNFAHNSHPNRSLHHRQYHYDYRLVLTNVLSPQGFHQSSSLKIRYKDYVNLSGWTSSGFNVTPVAT